MTYMEWITRVEKYRAMDYMRLPEREKKKIRQNYYNWYIDKYHREPTRITI
jgi:hypothetical protein